MNLFPDLKRRYEKEQLSAREAQRQAEFIAWGPIVFQATRLMLKFGILELLRDNDNGLTEAEVAEKAGLSRYATKCLLEASLCIGTVLIDAETDRYSISKTGWFLLNDPATKVNIDFNHDVNYLGMFNLEEALSATGRHSTKGFPLSPSKQKRVGSTLTTSTVIHPSRRRSRLSLPSTLSARSTT